VFLVCKKRIDGGEQTQNQAKGPVSEKLCTRSTSVGFWALSQNYEERPVSFVMPSI